MSLKKFMRQAIPVEIIADAFSDGLEVSWESDGAPISGIGVHVHWVSKGSGNL